MAIPRKTLYLVSAALCGLVFFALGTMIFQQSGLAFAEKRSHYSRVAKSKADTLSRRLGAVLEKAGTYTNSAMLAEIFTRQSLSLQEFPEDFRSGLKRVRIADASGRVLYSTMGTPDAGVSLSKDVLALGLGSQSSFVVFTPNQDTFAALARYENPLSLQAGGGGYILFEFTASALLRGLGGLDPVVRVEQGVPLLVLRDNPRTTYQQISSFNIFQQPKGAPLAGFLLNVPYMGNVVYYMGNHFYFPPVVTLAGMAAAIAMVLFLYLYTKAQGISVFPENRGKEVRSLMSDIKEGRGYPADASFDAVSQGSKFGALPKDFHRPVRLEKSTAEIPLPNPFVFESLDSSNGFEEPETFEKIDDFQESANFREAELLLAADGDMDLPDDSTLMDDEELPAEGFENSSSFPSFEEEGFEETFRETPEEFDPASKALEALLSSDEEIVLGSLDRYNSHVDALQEEYGLSRRASAKNMEGLFLIEDEKAFGPSFQIAAEDPIFKEILSEGKVLSLSGGLEESEYIQSLVAPEILQELSDLFIVPILDDEKSVSDIVVLGRNKNSPPLSVGQLQELFSYD